MGLFGNRLSSSLNRYGKTSRLLHRSFCAMGAPRLLCSALCSDSMAFTCSLFASAVHLLAKPSMTEAGAVNVVVVHGMVSVAVDMTGGCVGVAAGAPETGVVLAEVSSGRGEPVVGGGVVDELKAVVADAGGVYVCVT